MIPQTHFKGWAKPGAIPPGARGEGPEIAVDETLDSISGHFRLFQLAEGHRFSTDDVLTAWYGTTWCPSASHVLELGSGLGTVGMIAAWRLPGTRFVTVEAQARSVELAQKSALWNGISERFDQRLGDFRDPALLGSEERFDLVLGSPPYFPSGSGVESTHPQKAACRFELRGTVADYCLTASRHLNLGGIFACVFPVQPAEQHTRILAGALAAGLVVLRMRPVIFREGEAPLLGLFALGRLEDLPERIRHQTWTEPPLIIRRKDGTVHPEYAAVKLSFGFPP